MYKLMVVDDEEIIRTGISTGIKWDEIGFEICSVAENGLLAVKEMNITVPDVIILDICMPSMDGMQLMEYVSENFPDVKMVILSGYKEFEYAKKAIINHVYEYLLKPTHISSFIELFSKIKAQLDDERQKKQELDVLKSNIEENKPYLKQIFLNQLVTGQYINKKQILNKIDFYNLKIESENFVVIVIEIDSLSKKLQDYSEEGKQLLDLVVIKISNEFINKAINMELFIGSTGGVIGICDADKGLKYLIQFFETIQNVIYRETNVTVSIGISEVFDNILLMHRSYLQAKEAIAHKICLGMQSMIFYSDIEIMVENEIPDLYFDIMLINSYIFNMQLEELQDYISSVFDSIGKKVFKSAEFIDICIQKIVFNVETYFYQYGVVVKDILEKNNYSFSDLYSLNTLESKSNWLISVLISVEKELQDKRTNRLKGIVFEIQKYVDKNYCDNGLSLDKVSDVFNKSPQYISKLFKENLKENFSDYIAALRIERAKALLNDFSIKISDIGEMIGYADISYFTKKFRLLAGVSPSQYRNNKVK